MKFNLWYIAFFLIFSHLHGDMWVQIPTESPYDWSLDDSSYPVRTLPGYSAHSGGYHIGTPENLEKLTRSKEKEQNKNLLNYGKKFQELSFNYNPVKAARSLRFGKQFRIGGLMVEDFYKHVDAQKFGFDNSKPPVNGAYSSLFDVLYFIGSGTVPEFFANLPGASRPQAYNTYDVRSYMMETGWPCVRGCINSLGEGSRGDYPSQLILEGISGKKFRANTKKWTEWYEANKNGRLPKIEWAPTKEGQAARLVWGDLIKDRYENADPLFAAATREIPELATEPLLEILASDNILASLNASALISSSTDPEVQKRILKIIENKPHIVKIRVLKRLLQAGCKPAFKRAMAELKKARRRTHQAPYIKILGGGNRVEAVAPLVEALLKYPKDEYFKEICLRSLSNLVHLDKSIPEKIKDIKPRSGDARFYHQLIMAEAGNRAEAKKAILNIQRVASSSRYWSVSGVSKDDNGNLANGDGDPFLKAMAKGNNVAANPDPAEATENLQDLLKNVTAPPSKEEQAQKKKMVENYKKNNDNKDQTANVTSGSTVTISLHESLKVLANNPDRNIRKDVWKKFIKNQDRLSATVLEHFDFEGFEKEFKKLEKWALNEGSNDEFRAAALKRILDNDLDKASVLAKKNCKKISSIC